MVLIILPFLKTSFHDHWLIIKTQIQDILTNLPYFPNLAIWYLEYISLGHLVLQGRVQDFMLDKTLSFYKEGQEQGAKEEPGKQN